MQLYLVSALIFALIVAIFAVQNTTMVTIAFIIWQFKISLVLVILGAAAIGAFCVFMVGSFKNIGVWRKHRELEGKNKLLNDKIKSLEEQINQLKEKEENDGGKNIEVNERQNGEEAVQATESVK